ncbi:MAG: TIGR04282 family arsenosugar biosynthesis glycosyltransferase [Myxococcota bacterium]|nr:TIGR04282 family arsenosugar biosynthesis glycosyltransferase [Myxococcota bacterium]
MVITSIFFKVPTPGRVKTRLAQGIGADHAAALARVFFLDTLSAVSKAPGLKPVVATTGQLPAALRAQIDCPIWQQGDGLLGERLERVLRRALEESHCAIALGADSPGLGPTQLSGLITQLDRHDAVMGPTEDGGYYALGLNRCPVGLLDTITWSSPETRTQTINRLNGHGLTCGLAPSFFDIDHPSDLNRLMIALDAGELEAPHTYRWLRENHLGRE